MLKDSSGHLTVLLRNLSAHWDDLRTIWDDSVQRDFERKYIEPLQVQVESMRRLMDELGDAVERARTIIEDR